MARIFVADDKFADVIAALEARGDWRRHAHLSFPKPALRWTNYARVPWPRVAPAQIVNHLQHAVLFSQKHRLAALLRTYRAPSRGYGDASALVDAFFPRTVDLCRPGAWRKLHKWAVYSEAVAVAKRFARLGDSAASDALAMCEIRCAVAFLRAVLSDNSFFRRSCEGDDGDNDSAVTSGDAVEADASQWELLASRWTAGGVGALDTTGGSIYRAQVTLQAVRELLEQLAQRDPQLGAVGDGEGEGCVWICKPSNLSQGRGIALVRSLQELVAIVGPSHEATAADAISKAGQTSATQHWVVQKYVERPLLRQGGRKFDIRQWVLVTALPPEPQVYWFRDCYLRFCAVPFSLHSASQRQDRFAHLSNYSVQKDFVSSGKGSDAPPPSFESMWSSERFRDSLRDEHGSDVWGETVVPRMQTVARHVLRAVLPELRMVGKGFEWLGFDFLLDEDMCVWLLEVNVSPDVSHSTPVTAELVPRATADALSCAVGGVVFNTRATAAQPDVEDA